MQSVVPPSQKCAKGRAERLMVQAGYRKWVTAILMKKKTSRDGKSSKGWSLKTASSFWEDSSGKKSHELWMNWKFRV